MKNTFLEIISSPLMNLDHTKRYSGTKLVEEETLSQHMTDTIMMGLKVLDHVNYLAGYELIDPKLYILKAVYHDLEECITGDIPRPLKYYNNDTLQSMRDVADKVARELFTKEFYDPTSHYDVWDSAKEGSEGHILKIVDTLVVASKVVKEVSLLHNYYMLRVAHEVSIYLKEQVGHPHYNIESVDSYLDNLIQGAIDTMQQIIGENSVLMTNLNVCQQSMI